MWPGVLEAVKNRRRFTWILLSQNAQVTGFDGTTLQLGFPNVGARDNFASSGSEDVLKAVLAEQFQVNWKIDAVVGGEVAEAGPVLVLRPGRARLQPAACGPDAAGSRRAAAVPAAAAAPAGRFRAAASRTAGAPAGRARGRRTGGGRPRPRRERPDRTRPHRARARSHRHRGIHERVGPSHWVAARKTSRHAG